MLRLKGLIGILLSVILPSVISSESNKLCQLPSKRISLVSKDSIPHMVPHENTRLYLSLCHKLGREDLSVSEFCDTDAFACITKIGEDAKEEAMIRNAGNSSDGLKLAESHNGVSISYSNGENCFNGDKNVSYTTNIDFFCTQNADKIEYIGLLEPCMSMVHWQTKLACLPGQLEQRETGSCVIDIPGYDVRLDLSSWAHPKYYTTRPISNEDKRYFQLNLCSPVVSGLCTKNSVVCEVDENLENLERNVINEKPMRIVSYNELSETITLKYIDSDKDKVFIDISCDKAALEPELLLLSNEDRDFHFSMKTDRACFVPSVSCNIENQQNEIFNFENLRGNEWDFTVPGTATKYQIKVCGSLPIISQEKYSTNPCERQTGICTFNDSEVNATEVKSLGVMKQRPVYNEDGSISMYYEDGELADINNSSSCKLGAEIRFRCHTSELGPVLLSSDTCTHVLQWDTPEACPIKSLTTHSCTIREPIYNHLFNLSFIHNDIEDNIVKHNNRTFYFNLCGDLHNACPDKSVCFSSSRFNLTYNSELKMQMSSDKKCSESGRENKTISVDIKFSCNHDIPVGSPKVLDQDDLCHYTWEWATRLACPPHDVTQCSVAGPDGEVDLGILSLPDTNYQVPYSNGGKIILNVCRSIVNSKDHHCPYAAAACLVNTTNGQVIHESLGEVQRGLLIDEADGSAYLEYKLGSVCREPNSNKSHIQTIINFECANVTDTEPELVDSSDCSYQFRWKHEAACTIKKTKHPNCIVTNPNTGFTYDLSSLQKHSANYKWSGNYHHIFGSFDFNLCGPMVNSKCGDNAGICKSDGTNFGKANNELNIEDDQLYLEYSEGDICEDGQRKMTRINFNCPYARTLAAPSGNYEQKLHRFNVQQHTRCFTLVNFPTELACEHQVLCEASSDDTNQVFSFTKLRKHQENYHVPNVDPGKPEFVLNVCGPLVSADVNSTECSSHSACTKVGNEFVGLGKAESSPIISESGATLEYYGGQPCNSRGDHGDEWSTVINFKCDTKAEQGHPFGFPRHIATDEQHCRITFEFPTILACDNLDKIQEISEADSCHIYHSQLNRYIDITPLMRDDPYIIKKSSELDQNDRYEIQPCGKIVPSCKGPICHVSSTVNESLGHLTDFVYREALESINVDYREGDFCDSNTKKRYTSKIIYRCEPDAGLGQPIIEEEINCAVWFSWATSLVCPQNIGKKPETTTTVIIDDNVDLDHVSPPKNHTRLTPTKTEPRVTGSTGSSSWIILLLLVMTIIGAAILYLKPEARERVYRVVQGTRARLPVFLGGRRRDDTTLLVSDGRMTSSGFGAMSVDEEFG